jgi:hypothetical protein
VRPFPPPPVSDRPARQQSPPRPQSNPFTTQTLTRRAERILHGTSNSPLPPSVEAAYYKKCIELKRRLTEIEANNDRMRVALVRHRRAVRKHRLERAFLLDALARGMADRPGSESERGSEDEDDEEPASVRSPSRFFGAHAPPSARASPTRERKLTATQPLDKPSRTKRRGAKAAAQPQSTPPPPPDPRAPPRASPPEHPLGGGGGPLLAPAPPRLPAAPLPPAQPPAPAAAGGGAAAGPPAGAAPFVAFEPPGLGGRAAAANGGAGGHAKRASGGGGHHRGVAPAALASPGAAPGGGFGGVVGGGRGEEERRSNGLGGQARRESGDVSMTEDGQGVFMAVNR